MMPIGPLMKEHRVIETMLPAIRSAIESIEKTGELDVLFASKLRDFVQTYADRCHHGKEEDILFAELETRDDLSDELRQTMEALKEDHRRGRDLTALLGEAGDCCLYGNRHLAAARALEALRGLEALYPDHIDMEDNHFFRPVMELLTEEEQEAMLRRMDEADRNLLDTKYREQVEELRSEAAPQAC